MFLKIVGFYLSIYKLMFSTMILLLTFIAQSIYKYINSKLARLELQQKQQQQQQQQQQTITATATTANQSDSFDKLNSTATSKQFQTSFNEPEIFLFNESFDLNLLNLKKRKSLNSIDSSTDEDLYSNSIELINNLNKLYKNENICDVEFNYDEKSLNLSNIDSLDLDMIVDDDDDNQNENECLEDDLEASNYVDIDDSLFNTILFENSTLISTPSEKANDEDMSLESLLTRSDTRLILNNNNHNNNNNNNNRYLNPENLCFSLALLSQGDSTESACSSLESSISSCSSGAKRIQIQKAYKSLKRTMALKSKLNRGHIRLNKTLCTKSNEYTFSNTKDNDNDSSLIKHKKFRSRFERINQTKKFYQRRQRTSSHSNQNENNEIIIDLNTNCKSSKSPKFRNYKPSFKVEKLLNDSRGMKKYLIDYDCLMSQQKAAAVAAASNQTHKKTISLNNLNFTYNQDNTTQTSFTSSNVIVSTNVSNSISSIELDKFSNSNENNLLLQLSTSLIQIKDDIKDTSMQFNNVPSSNRCSSGYLSDC